MKLPTLFSTFNLAHVSTDMLKSAVEHVTNDEHFHLPLEPASTALRIAKAVLEWCSKEENKVLYYSFEEKVIATLQTCLPNGCLDLHSFQTQKVDLWRTITRYNLLMISMAFGVTFSSKLPGNHLCPHSIRR